MKLSYIAVAAVLVVAGLLVLPQLNLGGIALGDINERANAQGMVADGYADIEIVGFIYLTSAAQAVPFWSTERLYVNETLGPADGPVLTVLRPATIDTDCMAQYEIMAQGPHIAPFQAKSEEKAISVQDSRVSFKFGHMWLFKDSKYSLTLTLYGWDCLGMLERTQIRTDTVQITFDGISESFNNGGT